MTARENFINALDEYVKALVYEVEQEEKEETLPEYVTGGSAISELISKYGSKRITAATINNYASKGKIPVVRENGRLIFHVPTVLDWDANGRTLKE